MTQIKPYFEREGIRLYCGDARKLIRELEFVEVFDLCIGDPPYGETSLDWDRWPQGWVEAVWTALKANGTMWCFGSARMFRNHHQDLAPWDFVQDLIWEKQGGSGFHDDRFNRVHEQVHHFRKPGCLWENVYKNPVMTYDAVKRIIRRNNRPKHFGNANPVPHESIEGGPRLQRSVIYAKNCHGYAQNETQKPFGIVDPLVHYSCPPGGSILVPFAGSGTDLEVAFTRGLTAVGIEIREDQCRIAAERISKLLPTGVARDRTQEQTRSVSEGTGLGPSDQRRLSGF